MIEDLEVRSHKVQEFLRSFASAYFEQLEEMLPLGDEQSIALAEPIYERGLLAQLNRDLLEAARCYLSAAMLGHADATYLLALLLDDHFGIDSGAE